MGEKNEENESFFNESEKTQPQRTNRTFPIIITANVMGPP